MSYIIKYYCFSHLGKCRTMNQDNLICNGKFMSQENEPLIFPIIGEISAGHPTPIGVFDGMGGEECGEIASRIAAENAAKVKIGADPLKDLLKFCNDANEAICTYAEENSVFSMGTTAALLVFSDKEILLCNIGDSKIFRFADKHIEQISFDHVAIAAHGLKPPLSQNLGIPASEMIIEPYVAKGEYNDGDIYLICSDGLTDMVSEDIITDILLNSCYDNAAYKLLESALENGGKDNITIILCKIERKRKHFIKNLFNKAKKEENDE